jgi:hypothetical protein
MLTRKRSKAKWAAARAVVMDFKLASVAALATAFGFHSSDEVAGGLSPMVIIHGQAGFV